MALIWLALAPLLAAAVRIERSDTDLLVRTLAARAAYTASTSRAFTVSVPLTAIASTYDAEGNVTSRSFGDGRVQTLTWDAWNRLIKVTERNVANDGYDWSAVYDGLGRRLQTTHQLITAGAASGAPTVIASLFDPEAEFMEIGVVANGIVAWKVHGPDLDGRYGGWNGTGGLEAVLTADPESAIGAFTVKAVLTDTFGNTVATLAGLGPLQKAEWLSTRVGGYSPLPNHRAEVLTSADRLPETLAWRGRRIDPTGFYWLGARYYEPHSGRFLSPDPLGHASDMSLYAFANGDPVNRFDPDGRLMKKANKAVDSAILWDGWDSAFWQNVTLFAEGAQEGAATWYPGVLATDTLSALDQLIWSQTLIDPQMLMMLQPEIALLQLPEAGAALSSLRGLAANNVQIVGSGGPILYGARNRGAILVGNAAESVEVGASRLVGANRAVIDPRKLTEYALNPSHPVGGNKAVVFEKVLGYNQTNAEGLLQQIRTGVMNNTPTPGLVNQYGARFTVDIPVTGPAGSGVVRTGWIFKSGSTTPELTTLFVK